MDKVTVCIEVEEDGTITVGKEPPEGEEGQTQAAEGAEEAQEQSYMQPVRSVDEALAKARELLDQAMHGQDQAQEEAGFHGGFAGQAPQSISGFKQG